MNKTAVKIFACFTVISAVVATILLVINFLGFAIIGSDVYETSPKRALEQISEALRETADGFALSDEQALPSGCWSILINADGDIVWEQDMPDDIPLHYSINDIAKMTRWFLNDYPVYVRTEETGLLVLGLPKNAVGKYDMNYSMEWFHTLPQRLLGILTLNLFLAAILAFIIGFSFYRRIRALTDGIGNLRQEKRVKLREKGIFKELAGNINATSAAVERKNAALSVRDQARLNWISGISHDIRTPLAVIMGNSQMLENSEQLSEEDRRSAAIITGQAMKIKKLVADLNLISSLEYDMQPAKRKPVRLCPLIRETVSDIINSGLPELYEIELNLQDEKMTVLADESLLGRAVFNLINNSITHNQDGCKIRIRAYEDGETAQLLIADNGCGVPESVIENISKMPKTAHGLGLPMAYRIIAVHGGSMTVRNNSGCAVEIELPLLCI